MEKYSKAVSAMYSQFKQREAHPLEKYIGRLAYGCGEKLEVVGYRKDTDETWALIVDGTKIKSWCWGQIDNQCVVFKNCECYYFVGISDLID